MTPWGSTDGVRLQVSAGEVVRVAQRVSRMGGLGPGSIGLVVDGYGMLALALDRRAAADELQLATADQVTLGPLDERKQTAGVSVPVSMRPTPR